MSPPNASGKLLERALTLHRSERPEDAEPIYRQVIFRDKRNHLALFSLSVLLFEAGRLEEGVGTLERAVALRPNEAKYLCNLGEAYRRTGKPEQAVATFERILGFNPDFVEARQNLGVTLMSLGAHEAALPHLARAVELRPADPILHVSLAWLLLRLRRPEEALAHARRATELNPHLASAHQQLAGALDAFGDSSGAIASYRRTLALEPGNHAAHSSLIMAMLTEPGHDAKAHLAEAVAWSTVHGGPLRKLRRPHLNDRDPDRRLRVGYVSPDFRAHALQQFMVPLLEHHDTAAVEVFLYGAVDRPDTETDWYRGFAGERYRDLRGLNDEQAAELVRGDHIDILVDLALHSAGTRLRLFALKPAPVQITWLGYAGTTGLDAMDYRLTDPFLDPPGTDLRVYSETSLCLPETSWCYAPLCELPVGPLPALSAGHVTFGSQNTHRKLNREVLALWARVLREVPDSRIVLHAEEHAWEGLRETLGREGVAPDRIDLGGRVSREEYLRRYDRIDLGLDTFPFNGATTTLDAAWMGVPVVTLRGSTALQRAGTCIAMNLGLPELVAHTEDELVARVVALSRDRERLAELRAGLRARLAASPLGDVPRFARHLEAAYRAAWRRHCGAA